MRWGHGRWGLRLGEITHGGDGLANHAVVGFGVVGGPANLVFDVRHRLEHELGDIGEGGGFAWGDSALGESLENFAENVVDVETGVEVAGERRELGGELFGFKKLLFFAGVEDAKSRMAWLTEHTTATSIGERAETPGSQRLLGVHFRPRFGFWNWSRSAQGYKER